MTETATRLALCAEQLRVEKTRLCKVFDQIKDHCIADILNIAIEKLDSAIIEVESAGRMSNVEFSAQAPAIIEQLVRSHELLGKRGIYVVPKGEVQQ